MKITQNKLFLKQKVELLQVFSGFETKNRYMILDEQGNELFYAFEESSFWSRNLLRKHRKLKITIMDAQQNIKMTIERPFSFIVPEYTIRDENNQIIGTIKQQLWSWLPKFNFFGQNNEPLGYIKSKLFKPWTFPFYQYDQLTAQILKKWSGLKKEMFTQADTFMIDFNAINDNRTKELLLAATFAIDLKFFEKNN